MVLKPSAAASVAKKGEPCPGPSHEEGKTCGRPVRAFGHCQMHALQVKAGEPLRPLRPQRAFTPKEGARCRGPASSEKEKSCGRTVFAQGLCVSHYRMDLANEPLRPIKPTRSARTDKPGVLAYGHRWTSKRVVRRLEAEAAKREDGSASALIVELVTQALKGKRLPAGTRPEPGPLKRFGHLWPEGTVAQKLEAVAHGKHSPNDQVALLVEERLGFPPPRA